MRTNELDRHFVIDFIMGGLVFLLGLVGFFIILFWDNLHVRLQFQNNAEFGLGQCVGIIVSVLLMAGSGLYVKSVIDYIQAYGE